MKGVIWNVRVDASVDPVTTVIADGWYEARALAAAKLNVDARRLHVEQCQDPTTRDEIRRRFGLT